MFPGCSDKHLIPCHRLALSLVSAGALRSGDLCHPPHSTPHKSEVQPSPPELPAQSMPHFASPSQKIFHHISGHSLCICLFRNVRRTILFQQLFDAVFTPCAVNSPDSGTAAIDRHRFLIARGGCRTEAGSLSQTPRGDSSRRRPPAGPALGTLRWQLASRRTDRF